MRALSSFSVAEFVLVFGRATGVTRVSFFSASIASGSIIVGASMFLWSGVLFVRSVAVTDSVLGSVTLPGNKMEHIITMLRKRPISILNLPFFRVLGWRGWQRSRIISRRLFLTAAVFGRTGLRPWSSPTRLFISTSTVVVGRTKRAGMRARRPRMRSLYNRLVSRRFRGVFR